MWLTQLDPVTESTCDESMVRMDRLRLLDADQGLISVVISSIKKAAAESNNESKGQGLAQRMLFLLYVLQVRARHYCAELV